MPTITNTPGPGKAQLELLIKNLGKRVLKTGWFPSAREEDGTPSANAAAVNEFGDPSKNIPPRSFMRTTMTEKKTQWVKISEQLAKEMLRGQLTGDQALDKLGFVTAGDIRQKITEIQEPPLSPSTISQRLSKMKKKTVVGKLTKPLVFTGLMLNQLSHEVTDE